MEALDLSVDAFTHPHSHVKGDDGDADVLRGLPVDVGQLQPGVVLLLPRLQGVSGCERRRYRKEATLKISISYERGEGGQSCLHLAGLYKRKRSNSSCWMGSCSAELYGKMSSWLT